MVPFALPAAIARTPAGECCRGARSGVRCASGLGGAGSVSNPRCTKLIRCRRCPPSSRRQLPPLRASTSHANAARRNRSPFKYPCRPAGGRRACSRHHVALRRIGRLTDAIVPQLCKRFLQGERQGEVLMPRTTAARYRQGTPPSPKLPPPTPPPSPRRPLPSAGAGALPPPPPPLAPPRREALK